MGRWKALIVLGTAQFLMVLDTRLKVGLLAVAGIALGSFWFTRRLPGGRLDGDIQPPGEDAGAERSQLAAPQL